MQEGATINQKMHLLCFQELPAALMTLITGGRQNFKKGKKEQSIFPPGWYVSGMYYQPGNVSKLFLLRADGDRGDTAL